MFTKKSNSNVSAVLNPQLVQFEHLLTKLDSHQSDFQTRMVNAYSKLAVKYGDLEVCLEAADLGKTFGIKGFEYAEIVSVDSSNNITMADGTTVADTEFLDSIRNSQTFDKMLLCMTSFNKSIMDGNALGELVTFSAPMPLLESAQNMFNGCTSLVNFSSFSSNLSDVTNMFKDCTAMTSWEGTLSNVNPDTVADTFKDCILDEDSLRNIVSTIKDIKPLYTDSSFNPKTIRIGLGSGIASSVLTEVNAAFSQKGWNLVVPVR